MLQNCSLFSDSVIEYYPLILLCIKVEKPVLNFESIRKYLILIKIEKWFSCSGIVLNNLIFTRHCVILWSRLQHH